MTHGEAAAVSVESVDEDGVRASGNDDLVLDVLFDERRIWSFWLIRDSRPRSGRRFVAWPKPLRRFLDGSTRVTVQTHVDQRVLFDAELRFGTGSGRIDVVNADGQPLGIDKSGRLHMTFETRSAAQTSPLLDSVEEVLEALHQAGAEAFPAYGTLLGAVREGRLIGHDSDADLGYVSRHPDPVDVIRESFTLQRRLAEMGYQTARYSGAGFKVLVSETDGATRGLDVFGGFLSRGHLMLMGEIRTPFEPEWIFPLGTTTLEGRTLPAPADPDRFLTATYGKSWRVPDPAFVFETPRSTSVRLNGWFRGTRVLRKEWDRRYAGSRKRPPRKKPDGLARFLHQREDDDVAVVDVGCGRGHNARWLARQGRTVLGLDFSARAFEYLADPSRADGLDLEFASLNLLELRHVLGRGARIAHEPGPRAALARHLVDALPATGRENLWRFLDLALRPHGRAYVEFLVSPARRDPWAQRAMVHPVDPGRVTGELERRGGRVVHQETVGSPQMGVSSDDDVADHNRRACRMVIEWQG